MSLRTGVEQTARGELFGHSGRRRVMALAVADRVPPLLAPWWGPCHERHGAILTRECEPKTPPPTEVSAGMMMIIKKQRALIIYADKVNDL